MKPRLFPPALAGLWTAGVPLTPNTTACCRLSNGLVAGRQIRPFSAGRDRQRVSVRGWDEGSARRRGASQLRGLHYRLPLLDRRGLVATVPAKDAAKR